MASRTINKDEVKQALDRLVDRLNLDGWKSELIIEGVPKGFEAEAVKLVFGFAIEAAVKQFKIACGVALIRGHDVITYEDCQIANLIDESPKTPEEILPQPEQPDW